MRILNWEGTVIKGFEVTTNEMGWIEKGQTFAINLKALGVYIVFERVHDDCTMKSGAFCFFGEHLVDLEAYLIFV